MYQVCSNDDPSLMHDLFFSSERVRPHDPLVPFRVEFSTVYVSFSGNACFTLSRGELQGGHTIKINTQTDIQTDSQRDRHTYKQAHTDTQTHTNGLPKIIN